jgi:hypothetical protein
MDDPIAELCKLIEEAGLTVVFAICDSCAKQDNPCPGNEDNWCKDHVPREPTEADLKWLAEQKEKQGKK